MQDQIQQELGLSPVDKEVVVLYEGERGEQPQEFWNDKRVVEIARPRPAWFSKNLLQKTTQPAATTKEVKPNDLGWKGVLLRLINMNTINKAIVGK